MPTEPTTLETAMADGKNLADLARELERATEAQSTNTVPLEQPAAPAQEPAAAEPDEIDLNNVPEVITKEQLKAFTSKEIERNRRKWESGATKKFEAAKRAEELDAAMRRDPAGTARWLASQYGGTLVTPQEARPAPPSEPVEDPDERTIKALRQKILTAQNAEDQLTAIDELTTLKARREVREVVRPLQQATLSQIEQQELAAFHANNPGLTMTPDVYRQVKAYQADVAKSPYVRPTEAYFALAGPALAQENARLRAQLAQPKATDDKRSAQVAGGGSKAPQGNGVDPSRMDSPQLEQLMRAHFRPD